MNERTLIFAVVAIIIAAVVVAIAVWFQVRRRRSERLRRHFGPEYDHVVLEHQDQARAEAELEAREKRSRKIVVRPLPPEDRDRFAQQWRALQASFVDNPGAAVAEADELLERVMSERGYPMGDFDQQAADISVDHPGVVQNYRVAHEIALRHQQGKASTEDLRQAVISYRALYEELLDPRPVIETEVKR